MFGSLLRMATDVVSTGVTVVAAVSDAQSPFDFPGVVDPVRPDLGGELPLGPAVVVREIVVGINDGNWPGQPLAERPTLRRRTRLCQDHRGSLEHTQRSRERLTLRGGIVIATRPSFIAASASA